MQIMCAFVTFPCESDTHKYTQSFLIQNLDADPSITLSSLFIKQSKC